MNSVINKKVKAIIALLAVVPLVLFGISAAASAAPGPKTITGSHYASNPNNPLAVNAWAVNNGYPNNLETQLLYSYENSTGTDHTLLGRLATQPSLPFFTYSAVTSGGQNVASYISQLQAGNSNALVQFSLFGIFDAAGGEGNFFNKKVMTNSQQAAYKNWISKVSTQIGASKVAIVMEPDAALLADKSDGTSAGTAADRAVRRNLISWAVQYLSAHNQNAAIYLDAGGADWFPNKLKDEVTYLKQVGIQYIRGFALGTTHYSTTSDEINYAKTVSDALSAAGVAGKKAVIDTSDNGTGYTWDQWAAKYPTSTYDNSRIPTATGQPLTYTLGIAPTWRVGNITTGITGNLATTAEQYVDGYLWFGRSYLTNQASAYNESKALAAAKYTTDYTLLHGSDAYLSVKNATVSQYGTWNNSYGFVAALSATGADVGVSSVSVSGTVNMAKIGNYTLTYTYAGISKSVVVSVVAPSIVYDTQVQNIGWQKDPNNQNAWYTNGQEAGTNGRSLRMESIKIALKLPAGMTGNVIYDAHVQNIGWQVKSNPNVATATPQVMPNQNSWFANGATAGTVGRSLRMEAFAITLTGQIANYYKVVYDSHVQNIGWQYASKGLYWESPTPEIIAPQGNWFTGPAEVGTNDHSLRMEALTIKLVAK